MHHIRLFILCSLLLSVLLPCRGEAADLYSVIYSDASTYHRGLVLYYLRQMWIADRHTKSPQVRTVGAFLFPYCRQGLMPRLVAVVSLIEPFADVVGNYTCHDGENKRDSEHIHTPSHCHV